MIAAAAWRCAALVTNLVDNALRYGERGRRAARRAGRPRRRASRCSTAGPGIPADEVERLKQPFTRLETARSGKGGSGLGLAIVDRIARHARRPFDLLPREGGGLVARVTFPVTG